MDIDIERLKADREYWDEVAPDFCNWACVRGGRLRGWLEYELGDEDGDLIPRPAKAPEVEWDGSGLPPAGCECEVRSDYGSWHKCNIIGHHGRRAVFFCDNWTTDSDYDAGPASEFRQIRTKEQRQREELEDYVYKKVNMAPMSMSAVDAAIDAAQDFFRERYNLEPKP